MLPSSKTSGTKTSTKSRERTFASVVTSLRVLGDVKRSAPTVEGMRSVAVFKWNGKLPNDDEDDPERLATELARPAAETLLAELRNRGYFTNVETPYSGEGGWHFAISVDDQTYSVFTMWTGIGKPDEDHFAIQPLLQRGCLGTLFIRQPPDYKLEPLCLVLDATLKAIPSVTHLKWLTDQEFKKAYCDGEPLPQNGAEQGGVREPPMTRDLES